MFVEKQKESNSPFHSSLKETPPLISGRESSSEMDLVLVSPLSIHRGHWQGRGILATLHVLPWSQEQVHSGPGASTLETCSESPEQTCVLCITHPQEEAEIRCSALSMILSLYSLEICYPTQVLQEDSFSHWSWPRGLWHWAFDPFFQNLVPQANLCFIHWCKDNSINGMLCKHSQSFIELFKISHCSYNGNERKGEYCLQHWAADIVFLKTDM